MEPSGPMERTPGGMLPYQKKKLGDHIAKLGLDAAECLEGGNCGAI